MNSIKGLLKSKVFYFNLITGAIELVNAFAPFLPPGTAMAVSVVGNVLLRFFTDKPLSEK